MAGAEPAKQDQREIIYENLRERILSLDIPPGEMLSENLLSKQMQAGRPTIRDALSRLAEEGYIVVYPQRGTEVALLNLERVRQAVFTHIVLEQAAIDEVCWKGMADDQIRQMEDALDLQKAMSDQDDTLRFLESELKTHILLSSFCKREHIWDVFRTIDCDLLRVNYLQYTTFNYKIYMSSLTSREHAQVEGRMLLDNLKRRDAQAAGLICSNHFNSMLWNAESLRGIYPQFFSGQA